MSAEALADLWRNHAQEAVGDDAPLYRAISLAVSRDPELIAVAQRAHPESHHPNHLFAAVRYLMLGGIQDELSDAFEAGDEELAVARFGAFVRQHADRIVDVLETRRTQTNEVGRVGVIGPALRHVCQLVQGDLGLLDVGASAGLNLLFDRIGCNYGTFRTMEDPPLEVDTSLATPFAPFDAQELRIGWRGGLDRAPVDLADEAAARWLLACVWPEQRDRVQRLASAIGLARDTDWTVRRGDAVDDLAAAVAAIPEDLHVVVLTSWVVFYLDLEQRARFEAVLGSLDRPVHWVSLEHPGVVDIPVPAAHHDGVVPSAIGLVSFDSGRIHRSFLGWAHPHGRWLDWVATDDGPPHVDA